jgi:hypothetical protein
MPLDLYMDRSSHRLFDVPRLFSAEDLRVAQFETRR